MPTLQTINGLQSISCLCKFLCHGVLQRSQWLLEFWWELDNGLSLLSTQHIKGGYCVSPMLRYPFFRQAVHGGPLAALHRGHGKAATLPLVRLETLYAYGCILAHHSYLTHDINTPAPQTQRTGRRRLLQAIKSAICKQNWYFTLCISIDKPEQTI